MHRRIGALLLLLSLAACRSENAPPTAEEGHAPEVHRVNGQTPHWIGRLLSNGQTHYLVAEQGEVGFLLHGPYVSLHEGSFKVTFRLRADRPGARDVATLDVNAFDPPTRTGRVLSSLIILGDDFAAPDQFRDFAVYFSTKGLARGTLYEFRVRSSGQSGLWVEQTTLQQVE